VQGPLLPKKKSLPPPVLLVIGVDMGFVEPEAYTIWWSLFLKIMNRKFGTGNVAQEVSTCLPSQSPEFKLLYHKKKKRLYNFFSGTGGLNSEFHTHKAGALLLEPQLQKIKN
jgi:hypothetical protein